MGSGEKSPLLDFFKCLWVIFYFGGVSSTGNTPVAFSALDSGTADWLGEFRRTECPMPHVFLQYSQLAWVLPETLYLCRDRSLIL